MGGVDVGGIESVGTVVALPSLAAGGATVVGGAATEIVGFGTTTGSPPELEAGSSGVPASAAADGELSCIGVSVTWDRTLPTAAAAIRIATIVAPTQAIPKPIPRLIRTVWPIEELLGYRMVNKPTWVGKRHGNSARARYREHMPSILIIEDDQRIRESLAKRLSERGHDIETVATAMDGVQRAVSGDFDVVILDLGLPDVDGAEALRMIRAVSDVPVVVATARDEDRILIVGGLRIDKDSHEATLDGVSLDLTARAFELLAFLASRPGKLIGKRELMAGVWHQPYGGADKTVDVHVSWLRRALGETASDPVYLHTRRGVGVRLVDPTQ